MSKITLTNIADLTNTTTSANAINTNNLTITNAFDNTLSLDGTSPNQMGNNLDMNSKQILNLPAPATNTSPLRLQDLTTFIGGGTITNIPIGGTTGQALLKTSNTNYVTGWGSTVQSVGLSLPADFTVTNSPVTTTGTLTGVWATTPTGTGAVVRATSPTLTTPTMSSPVMTGIPAAPTAAVDTSTTQVATTAMVIGQAASATPLMEGTAATGSSTRFARGDHVHPVYITPINSQSAAYTLVLSDGQKVILHPSADTTARTFTIPANASVAYPVGTTVTFVNQNAGGVITIAITTDTMRLAGAGTTGSRTLAANGVATAIKITSTEWIISGTGLT